MNEPPRNRCGYTYPNDHAIDDDPSQQSCCWRKTLDGSTHCVWHADLDKASVEALQEARASPEIRQQNQSIAALPEAHAIPLEVREQTRSAAKLMHRDDLPAAELLDGANLGDLELPNNISLERVSLRQSKLTDANLKYSNLVDADLEGADLRGANLEGADLRGANLKAVNLTEAILEDANLTDADLRDADLGSAYLNYADLTSVDLKGSDLSYADLRDADLRGAELVFSNLRDARLELADLTDADLRRAHLTDANLMSADLSDGNLNDGNLTETLLSDADLTGTDLNGVDLTEAYLKNANLSDADLRDADLTGADLTNTTAHNANLEKSKLSRVTLFDADLRGTKLHGSILGDAQINAETLFLGSPDDYEDRSPHTLDAIFSKARTVYDPNYSDEGDETNEDKAKSVYRALEELASKAARPRLQSLCFVRRQDLQKDGYKQDAKERDSWQEKLIASARYSRAKVARVTLLYGESPWRIIIGSVILIFAFTLLYPVGGWIKPVDGEPITYGAIAEDPWLLGDVLYYSTLTFTTLGLGDFRPIGIGQYLTTFHTATGAVLIALLVFVLGRRAAR